MTVFVSSCRLSKHPNVEASYLVPVLQSWLQLAKLPAFNLAIIYILQSSNLYFWSSFSYDFNLPKTCHYLPFHILPNPTNFFALFRNISLTSFILNFLCTWFSIVSATIYSPRFFSNLATATFLLVGQLLTLKPNYSFPPIYSTVFWMASKTKTIFRSLELTVLAAIQLLKTFDLVWHRAFFLNPSC